MAAGESQDCSWAARGWVRSLVFVLFSYASKAALKINWKLEEEEEEEDAMERFWDIVCIKGARIGWWVGERARALQPRVRSRLLFRGSEAVPDSDDTCLLTQSWRTYIGNGTTDLTTDIVEEV